MKRIVFCLLALAASAAIMPATAQSQESAPETLSFEGQTWRVTAREARVENYRGRAALFLAAGRIWLDDADFQDGVIEFDVSVNEGQGFIGPMWRVEDSSHFEEIYFRTHLSGKPDAVQYTPVENSLSAWQIFSDGNALAAIEFDYEGWNRVKVVVNGDAADFYFNSDTPQLHIPDLKRPLLRGGVGLRVSGAAGAARFSNITVRPLRPGETIVGEAKEATLPPKGLIETWSVSEPFAESDVEETLMLPSDAGDGDWPVVQVETNGIANLAKLADATENADTVFVRVSIQSNEAQMKELRFGYSDRVRIYLNGKRVYFGNAGWRVRDYRFLGTVGFFDSVGLDLRQGDNELLVAVSETFGGWAWAGAIEDQSGISLN
ncbi:MAG: hypothetical protein AAFW68_10975 [Pseudomonadota bacterium]